MTAPRSAPDRTTICRAIVSSDCVDNSTPYSRSAVVSITAQRNGCGGLCCYRHNRPAGGDTSGGRDEASTVLVHWACVRAACTTGGCNVSWAIYPTLGS